MGIRTLENALREHSRERSTKGKLAWVPLDILHALEETLPHGLVIELGELIMKSKGIGKNNI